MQIEGKNIDELFTRKLGNRAVPPPENGWSRIEEELNRRSYKERRKYCLAAASVVLLLGFAASFTLLQKAETPSYFKEPILVSNEPTNTRDKEPARQEPQISKVSDIQPVNTLPVSNPTRSAALQSNDMVVQKPIQATQMTTVIPLPGKHPVREIPVYSDSWEDIKHTQPMKINRLEFLTQKTDSKTPDVQINEKTAVETPPNMLVYNDISSSVYEDPVVNETFARTYNRPANRWEITGQFAPTYSYRSVTKVPDNMSKSDFDKAESGLLAYTGGLKVAYNASRRLSIQIGVYYTQTGQSVKQVIPTQNMYAAVSSNHTNAKSFVRTSSGNATITSNLKSSGNNNYANYFSDAPAKMSQNAVALTDRSQDNNTNYKLIERVDYLEIPLLLRYKLIDSRFNFYLLGGVSTNILIDNNVFIDNGHDLVKEGSLLLIRPVNYSSTVGMGLSYNINRNLSVNLEPSFKYYLQSYTTNNSISSNPFSLGIFTGIVCRF